MKWLVKLKQPEENEEDWQEILETLPVTVKREGDEVYFALDQFEQAADVHEVKEEAEEFVLRVNRGLSAAPIREVEFEVGGYFEIVEDGSRERKKRRNIVTGTALEIRAGSVSTDSSRERRVEIARSYALCALEDNAVNKVLALLEEEPTPTALYNIYEGIKKDIGGEKEIGDLGWASGKMQTNFRRSAMHYEASGLQARHVFKDWEPPESPMSAAEMKSFIERLAGQWLRYKADQS